MYSLAKPFGLSFDGDPLHLDKPNQTKAYSRLCLHLFSEIQANLDVPRSSFHNLAYGSLLRAKGVISCQQEHAIARGTTLTQKHEQGQYSEGCFSPLKWLEIHIWLTEMSWLYYIGKEV